MLLDNATSHSVPDMDLIKVGSFDSIKMSHLLLLFLPANCISLVQRLDQGIIAALKACYKSEPACHMVMQYNIELSQDLRALSLTASVKQVWRQSWVCSQSAALDFTVVSLLKIQP